MAVSSMLRRSVSSFGLLAGRLARSQRSYRAALSAAVNQGGNLFYVPCLGPYMPSSQFSSTSKRPSSDESLLKVIESEIKCSEETDDYDRVEEIPGGFPFKIEDNPGLQTITLTRTYQGEVVSVEVHMPDLVTGQNEGDDDDDADSGRATQSSIPLVVSVSKKGGPSLEFGCTAFPDEISIDSLSVRHPENSEVQMAYEGPDFQDLDENLQKAFLRYLEIRGIKPSTTNFLHEYMINKDSKEYLVWLKKLKSFIEA